MSVTDFHIHASTFEALLSESNAINGEQSGGPPATACCLFIWGVQLDAVPMGNCSTGSLWLSMDSESSYDFDKFD